MSRLKKPSPPQVATKDDLIESLLENESEGNAAFKTNRTNTAAINRLSAIRHSPSAPPPPPPSQESDEAVFNFSSESDVDPADVPTQPGMGEIRDDSIPKFNMDPTTEEAEALAMEEVKTRVAHMQNERSDDRENTSRYERSVSQVAEGFDADSDKANDQKKARQSEAPPVRVVATSIEEERERQENSIRRRTADLFGESDESQAVAKERLAPPKQPPIKNSQVPKDRLQKFEDVLRKMAPKFDASALRGKNEPRPDQNPIYQSVQPPPAKAPGVVAKAKLADSTPTPAAANADVVSKEAEVRERAPTRPVLADEEKTVAAAQTPSPVSNSQQSEGPRPVWQDAKTEVISRMTSSDNPDEDPAGEQFMPTEIRPNSPGVKFREQSRQAQPNAAIFSSAEAALRQSENLRVAQKRISDLENELERVRRENESLRSAGETLRRRMDESQAHAEAAELMTQETKKIAEEERKVLRGQISSRDREISELKGRIDDAEGRLESNFRKIRVRERDLEHRIEIIKAESQSIAASKDRMILELKRQIDQISSELNHAKSQAQETFNQFKERQETSRRAIRALRIALTVLEGDDDAGSRKAE